MKAATARGSVRLGSSRRRAPGLAVALSAVLLLHAALLSGATWWWPRSAVPPLPPATALEIRTLAVPVAAMTPPLPAATAQRSGETPAPRTPHRAPAAARPAPVQPIATPVATPAATAPTLETNAAPTSEPLYPTRIPPAIHWRYRVDRGGMPGSADLHWTFEDGAYEARLDIVIDGRVHLTQLSQGGFDAAGLAPRRFTERRRRGSLQAANFERAIGELIFSGPGNRYALVAGAQDRLSWMLQLAAVAAAQQQPPGSEIAIFVAGARGDGRVWLFRCEGLDRLDAGGVTIDALKWVREPGERYDTRVEVWLDPNRDHLPVRLRSTGSDALAWELVLAE